jgi:hypothetical protein
MFILNITKEKETKKIGKQYKISKHKNYEIVSKSEYSSEIMELSEKEIAKRINGILIVREDKKIRIYVDPFRTLPIFVYKDENEILITSEFDFFYDKPALTIDEVGAWEVMLYESCIGKRTIIKEVEQLFAASYIEFDTKTRNHRIDRYWNFSVKEDKSITTEEIALKKLDEKLTEIFKRKIKKTETYLLGVSGGLDSRLTLAYLNKIGLNNLKTVTYGYKEKILEYDYAKEISKVFGYSIPEFHLLNFKDYKLGKEELAKLSGGQISMHHVHLYSYLKRNPNKNLLSTYYTDAILGWATKKEKNLFPIEETQMYDKLMKFKNKIKNEYFKKIESDIKILFEDFDKESNFSNLDEYKYIIERNPKFHIYLGYQQERYSNVNLLFCDYELLELMISIPLKFRYEKKMVSLLLRKKEYFGGKLSQIKDVSSLFPWGEEYKGTKDYYLFKVLNRINTFFLFLTGGRVQLTNKYLTEDLNVILRKLKKEIDESIDYLFENKIIDKKTSIDLKKLPLRNSKTGEKYAVISVVSCLKEIMSSVR